ncbi:hypothetical protein [Ancylobacter sp. SL191]|uniref:hypothetical protein n=1 Tax=Ancylobacter sp. SL191 TaxID=2995166 RepID=UPI00226E67A5|nr:hypothetical protein [Ancylobacter sp. SL191]WAC29643.1 hypothetical protein OU996_01880 [Ancylobacter sp. SL191]
MPNQADCEVFAVFHRKVLAIRKQNAPLALVGAVTAFLCTDAIRDALAFEEPGVFQAVASAEVALAAHGGVHG